MENEIVPLTELLLDVVRRLEQRPEDKVKALVLISQLQRLIATM